MPAAKTQPSGGQMNAYYNSATNASPTWVELTRIDGFSYQDALNTTESKLRGNGWTKEIAGKFKIGLTTTYQRTRNADTVYAALRTAYLAKTPIQIAHCDRPIAETGAKGIKAYYLLKKMDDSQDTESPWQTSIELGHAEFEESGSIIDPADFTTA